MSCHVIDWLYLFECLNPVSHWLTLTTRLALREGEVVQDIDDHHSGIINHRRNTRQRHLSSGQDDNIASAYFAAQYGGCEVRRDGNGNFGCGKGDPKIRMRDQCHTKGRVKKNNRIYN